MKHIIYADLDTIVFEGREQSYGAYQMRRKYNRLLGRSTIIAFLLFISITGLPKVIDWILPNSAIEQALLVQEFVPLDALPAPVTREKQAPVEPPPPPPEQKKTPPPAQRAQIAFAVIEPAPKDQVSPDETIKDMKDLLEVDTAIIGTRDLAGLADDGTGELDWNSIGEGDGEPAILKEEDKEPSDKDFVFVEEMPRPVNMEQLRDLIGYPSQAVEATIEGKVIVRVLVDELGSYRKHVVLKNPHPILTKAVEKQLKHLQFTPGIQASQPIKVWVNIPFEFILNQR